MNERASDLFLTELGDEEPIVDRLRRSLQTYVTEVDGVKTRVAVRGVFESEKAQTLAEKTVIELSQSNDGKMLEVFRLLVPKGVSYIEIYEDLIKKYDLEDNENLRVLAYLWELTSEFWSATYMDVNDFEDQARIAAKIEKVMLLATELAGHSVMATHQTRTKGQAEQVQEDGIIYKSDSGSQYEGLGVYTGILGGFKSWGSETFTFPVYLAFTLPIIVSSTDPEAMANVLAQGVDISDGRPVGMYQWTSTEDTKLHLWQIEMLRKYIDPNLEVLQTYDEFEYKSEVRQSDHVNPVVVINSDKPPIVWASVARLLKIPEVIKKENIDDYIQNIQNSTFNQVKYRKLYLD